MTDARPVPAGRPNKARPGSSHPAKPAKGPVDLAEMRKDIQNKFPKTLAELAK